MHAMMFILFIHTVNCQSCFNFSLLVVMDSVSVNRNNDDNGVCDSRVDCSDRSDESQCGIGKSEPIC